MKAIIKSLEKVCINSDSYVSVSLDGMRADLSEGIIIYLRDIKNWFGVDEQGYSKRYSIRPGTTIYFDNISAKTRTMINPRFEE